ncbi:hypothetical protein EYF80_031403 [Liparis tanakae]|uniref:Secreted protein n=1 Tax=Liparis tanakae TaxID=230148 RepID=A0A4Z2H0G8_9TELE|nr:hypothetical protein EYF80_031403 [Liparis tanakae]
MERKTKRKMFVLCLWLSRSLITCSLLTSSSSGAMVPCVSRHTLAAEGAPLAVTATPVAAGGVAHVDTAAVGGQAARRAGLRVGRGAQIVQLKDGR